MIRIVRHDTMQFIQQFLGDNLWLNVFHPMYHAVTQSHYRSKFVPFFEPINQNIYRRPVVGGYETLTVLLIPGRVIALQIGTTQADAINLSIKYSLKWFANLV